MSVKCILFEQGKATEGSGSGVVLKKLEVSQQPAKIEYLSGDTFDPTGLELTASFGISMSDTTLATAAVPISACTITPLVLTEEVDYVTISYSKNGHTVSTQVVVTVNPALKSLAIVNLPSKVSYAWGDSFSTSGLVVKAVYTNETETEITGYTLKLGNNPISNGFSLVSPFLIGDNVITVSYTEDGRSASIDFEIALAKKSLAIPTQTETLTYNGAMQSPTLSGYNSSLMSISGNQQMNAGVYTAIVSLKDSAHYEWSGGSVANQEVSWSIGKANGSLSLSKTSINLTNTTPQTITITRAGDGVISYSPINISGVTMNLSGNILTITGDGNTNINNKIVTVKVAAGTNYNPSFEETFTISANYFNWNSGNSSADNSADWWTELKNWLPNSTEEERAALVGKTTSLWLTQYFFGYFPTHRFTVRCVGYDIEADKSLTFQMSDSILLENSENTINTARTHSNTFANQCTASNSILEVNKLTSSLQNGNTNNEANQATGNVKGFIPSAIEMGVGNIAPSQEEGTVGRVTKTYQYYISNSTRIKYHDPANSEDSSSRSNYWTRSKYYDPTIATDGTNYYVGISTSGEGIGMRSNRTTGNYPFAPAFVIGN